MTPYIGEIRLFAGSKTPNGWALCDGRVLQVGEYDDLFAFIGNTYGGDGMTTWALPDLRGRAPMHISDTVALGGKGGVESVALTVDQLAKHDHVFNATTAAAATGAPKDAQPATTTAELLVYTEDNPNAPLAPEALLPAAGGGRAHDNMHPFVALNFIIALEGLYPPHGDEEA